MKNECNLRYCHECSVINMTGLEKEGGNGGFWSLSVGLMTLKRGKSYYIAMGKIY